MKKDTFLIIDTSEENADLYYKTGFSFRTPSFISSTRAKKSSF